jgi:hypothetical protein
MAGITVFGFWAGTGTVLVGLLCAWLLRLADES